MAMHRLDTPPIAGRALARDWTETILTAAAGAVSGALLGWTDVLSALAFLAFLSTASVLVALTSAMYAGTRSRTPVALRLCRYACLAAAAIAWITT